MKNRLIIFLATTLCCLSCSKNTDMEDTIKTGSEGLNSIASSASSSMNEGMLAKVLLVNAWKSIVDLKNISHSNMRNSLITELNNRSSETISFLQAKNDEELAWAALMYRFLKDSGSKTVSELATMSFDDYRNTIITKNHVNEGIAISVLQSYDNKKNLKIAYDWWLPSTNSGKILELNDVTNNISYFDLKDDQNKTMDVLRIVKTGETAPGTYAYLGVYHSSAVHPNSFQLRLAGSNDLQNWTFIRSLGNRSHQGDIKKAWGGYVLLNEEDPVEGTNNIRARFYTSYVNLIYNVTDKDYAFPIHYSPSANGTPDIRKIEGTSANNSYILIGYHFYENNVVDQQGFGILKNFNDWRAWKDDITNYNVKEMGFTGNIGGRSGFEHGGGSFVILEAQLNKHQWQDWRLLLGDGTYYSQLNLNTPLNSTSFANPGIVPLGNNEFAVTSFLPSQGNQPGEIGELLYRVQF